MHGGSIISFTACAVFADLRLHIHADSDFKTSYALYAGGPYKFCFTHGASSV